MRGVRIGQQQNSELASPNFLICGDDLHVKMLMTPPLDIDAYQRQRGTPLLDKSVPAYDNPDWRALAERQELTISITISVEEELVVSSVSLEGERK